MSTSSDRAGTGPEGRANQPDIEESALFWRRLMHDLNNALTVVTINVAMLQEGTPDEDPDKELVDDAAQAAREAAVLANQLRRFLIESDRMLGSSE